VDRIKEWDFRVKNVLIYALSDLTASFLKAPFEVRKQLIQMYTRELAPAELVKLTSITWLPLALRDVLFRTIILSSYYMTTNVEHRPILKYTIPQLTDIMRQRRAVCEMEGRTPETVHDHAHLFYEFHNYEVKQNHTFRLTGMIIANLFATIVTNPIDVCLSKMATQRKQTSD
jgi:hypothetical protein